MERLIARGAAEVVPEMLETSIMLATHTLTLIGTPIARVIRRMRQIRTQRYSLMRGFFLGATDIDEGTDAQEERLHSVSLLPGAFAVSRRIGDLAFASSGARVAAVRRRGIRSLDPADDMILEAGDVVVLLGVPGSLAMAEKKLLKGS